MSNNDKYKYVALKTAMEAHPAAEIFPLLEGAEFDALVEDIKTNGLIEPIVTYNGTILDGRNRFRACDAAGKTPRFRPYTGDDPVAYVISANIRRRHLTPKKKRDLIAKLLKAQPDQSDRQIANQVKVDHKTVGKIRREEEGRGEIPHVSVRTDIKGRKQPAKKPEHVKARSSPPSSSTSPSSPSSPSSPVTSADNPIEVAWKRATQAQRREFSLAYRRDILQQIARPGADRAEATRLAADRAEARAEAAKSNPLDIPPELQRAAP